DGRATVARKRYGRAAERRVAGLLVSGVVAARCRIAVAGDAVGVLPDDRLAAGAPQTVTQVEIGDLLFGARRRHADDVGIAEAAAPGVGARNTPLREQAVAA